MYITVIGSVIAVIIIALLVFIGWKRYLLRQKDSEVLSLAGQIARHVFAVWAVQGPFKNGEESAKAMRYATEAVRGPESPKDPSVEEGLSKHSAAYDERPEVWESLRQKSLSNAGGQEFEKYLSIAVQLGAKVSPNDDISPATIIPEEDTFSDEFNFDNMNIAQIIEYIKGLDGTLLNGKELTRRLIDIIYLDYEATEEDQRIAQKLLDGVMEDFEAGFSGDPSKLEAYRAAVASHINYGEQWGRDTLAWKIRAPGVKHEDMVEIVIHPSSGTLIPQFIQSLGKESWESLKGSIIKELIFDRQRKGEHNAVLILAGLITKNDLVAWNILTTEERTPLANISCDYQKARNVLVSYNLIPVNSSAHSMHPQLPVEELAHLISQSSYSHEIGEDRLCLNEILDNGQLSEYDAFISLYLYAIKLNIWIDLITEVYGQDTALRADDIAMNIHKEHRDDILSFRDELRVIHGSALTDANEGTFNVGEDMMIATRIMHHDELFKNLQEEKQVATIDAIKVIFNIQRVAELHISRALLRSCAARLRSDCDSVDWKIYDEDSLLDIGRDTMRCTNPNVISELEKLSDSYGEN